MNDDDATLEVYRLVIGADEVEAEATTSVSEYLIERSAFYGNKLGREHKKLKQFDIVKDAMSDGWVVIFMCERFF